LGRTVGKKKKGKKKIKRGEMGWGEFFIRDKKKKKAWAGRELVEGIE
jgi:hypothetical protein